jgi:ParB family transcriptional regulator, chromosome partitioning protein
MSALQMIPMDHIEVLNPRDRNNRIFEVIVGNIKTLGLKKTGHRDPTPWTRGRCALHTHLR